MRTYPADRYVLFLGGGSSLYYPDGTSATTINACRAYFTLKNGITAGDPTNGVRAYVLNFGEDSVTGIKSLTPDTSPKDEGRSGWYTINGVKLQGKPTVRGIYINNGRKVVIK